MQIRQALANLYWIILFIIVVKNISIIIFIITRFRMQILPAVAKLYWMIHIGRPWLYIILCTQQTFLCRHSFLHLCISLQLSHIFVFFLFFIFIPSSLYSYHLHTFICIQLHSPIIPCSLVVRPNKLHPHTWFISDGPGYIYQLNERKWWADLPILIREWYIPIFLPSHFFTQTKLFPQHTYGPHAIISYC